ncbi:MAG: cysteine--tRNA ligase [Candidatus Schekmanbacteria bacterium]|nr:cysteine--tRNA ligase [Candidatus Schekmanbacteria bacterium]
MLRFMNTLGKCLEDFVPIAPPRVGLYTCGPTVYDHAHIGNFRTYVFEDLLRRYLEFRGYDVHHVMNITDVEDKTIARANAEGIPLHELTARYVEAFFEDIDALGILRAHQYPRATEHIPEMVEQIEKLIANGHAYAQDGSVFFRISTFPGYGRLSGMDMDGIQPGARVDCDEYEKEDVRDFALWKAPKTGEPVWQTRLGPGRPGWHIECSSMSMKYLGASFDIHTGGVDNIFPHHENEIAQAEGCTGAPFVRYWLHSEHLLVNQEKMSKSKQNFYTLRDLLARGYPARALRYALISVHYRKPLNLTMDALDAAAAAVERLADFHRRIVELPATAAAAAAGSNRVVDAVRQTEQDVTEALDEDLGVSTALGAVFDFVREMNRILDESGVSTEDRATVLGLWRKLDDIFGVFQPPVEELSSELLGLVRQREAARRDRRWKDADALRDTLLDAGVVLEDTPAGTRWKRRRAATTT